MFSGKESVGKGSSGSTKCTASCLYCFSERPGSSWIPWMSRMMAPDRGVFDAGEGLRASIRIAGTFTVTRKAFEVVRS